MKSSYRVRAIRFLEQVFPYIKDVMTSPSDVEAAIIDFNINRSRRVEVFYGSARIALVTSDYVVKWDYDVDVVQEIGGCDNEYSAYQKALVSGYSYLLAEAYLICYNGIHFLIMPRVRHIGLKNHGGRNIDEFLTPDEYSWLVNFVNDLHSWNWGIYRGRAVVIDYAMTRDSFS